MSPITYKFVVYAPAERADTLAIFLLHPYMYSVTMPATKILFHTVAQYYLVVL
jgi:hypothetical protein